MSLFTGVTTATSAGRVLHSAVDRKEEKEEEKIAKDSKKLGKT